MRSSTKRSMVIGGGLVVVLGVSGAIFAGCSNTTQGDEGTKPTHSANSETSGKGNAQAQTEKRPTEQKNTQVSPSALPKELTQSAAPQKQTEQKSDPEPTAQTDKALSDRKVSDNEVTGEYKAAAVLINKYSIIYNGQFQYLFELRMTNDNGSKVVTYYATKNVFDTAIIGDPYKVTYAGDSNGNLAIRTISQ